MNEAEYFPLKSDYFFFYPLRAGLLGNRLRYCTCRLVQPDNEHCGEDVIGFTLTTVTVVDSKLFLTLCCCSVLHTHTHTQSTSKYIHPSETKDLLCLLALCFSACGLSANTH